MRTPDTDVDRWAAEARVLKIFLLPPFLTLVVVLACIVALTDHLDRDSRQNTYVAGEAR